MDLRILHMRLRGQFGPVLAYLWGFGGHLGPIFEPNWTYSGVLEAFGPISGVSGPSCTLCPIGTHMTNLAKDKIE